MTVSDDVVVFPDHTSPTISGYFRIPPIWIGSSKPPDAQVVRLNPQVHHATVFRSELRCGIRVRAQRNGFFIFDFEKWPHAPAVTVPGYSANNNQLVPKAHLDAERKAAAFIVRRSKLMNVHQACFTTAEFLVAGRGAMMDFSVHSREIHGEMDFEAPQRYLESSEQPRSMAEAVLDNAYLIAFERPHGRRVIELPVIERSFQLLDDILMKNDPHLIELIHNFYIASIRGRETHLGEALVLAWGVCEQLLSVAWKAMLSKVQSDETIKRMNKDRRKKFDGRDYTASVIIEILELQGKLDTHLYTNLETARKARNRWAHELELPSGRDVYACMAAAIEMLRNFLGVTLHLQRSAEDGAVPQWPIAQQSKAITL
jgi:hypothetical protein